MNRSQRQRSWPLQLVAVDLARQFQHAAFVLAGLGAAGQRGVGQLGVVAVVADAGGEFRLVLEAPLPVALEQGARLFLGRRGKRPGGQQVVARGGQQGRGEQGKGAGQR
jgi:hypothetical protein